ncbi:MAG: hypothetical protein R2712_22210 [Vicinamibacterales bacterium]
MGNGGITLPQGFCAQVVATDLVRHVTRWPRLNGDLYVALMTRGGRGDRPLAEAWSGCATTTATARST